MSPTRTVTESGVHTEHHPGRSRGSLCQQPDDSAAASPGNGRGVGPEYGCLASPPPPKMRLPSEAKLPASARCNSASRPSAKRSRAPSGPPARDGRVVARALAARRQRRASDAPRAGTSPRPSCDRLLRLKGQAPMPEPALPPAYSQLTHAMPSVACNSRSPCFLDGDTQVRWAGLEAIFRVAMECRVAYY
jgi:hypothetical protein